MNEQPTTHPHGAMRRKDREITDRAVIDEIIRAARVMHLALADNNMPFLVPVFYAYDGQSLYFHSAPRGTKVDIMKRNPNVCFEITTGHGVIENEIACDFEARHRTVIGRGTVEFLTADDEKKHILDLIVARFTDKKFDYPPATVSSTNVIRITITGIKGKQHGY